MDVRAGYKIKLVTLAMLAILTVSLIMVSLPQAAAHDPPWTIPTYAYIVVTPNPVGVGEQVFVVMWLDKPPPTAAGIGGDRWTGFKVEVTKPDGTKETMGPYISDSTSSTFALYTPNQIGTYKFDFSFPGQVASLYHPVTGIPRRFTRNFAFINDTYLGSSASTTITVQQNPVALPPTYPLPTSYWTRPIEAQNTLWESLASNYLGGSYISGLVQPTGAAPSTPHVMWTKVFQDGGIVGGNFAAASGMSYYDSLSYESKFSSALIINERLYYTLPRSNNVTGNGYVCVNLRTGETLFRIDDTMPTFGQLYDYESMNQHGVIPNGYLWRSVNDPRNGGTVWMAYDSIDGKWLFNETNVPSGTTVYGPNGEILIYQLNLANKWLALWNNTAATDLQGGTGTGSAVFQWRPIGKNVNASEAYTWNITIPTLPAGSTIRQIIHDDLMLVSTATQIGGTTSAQQSIDYTITAVSLKPANIGQLLWSKTYQAAPGNLTRQNGPIDPINRVFMMSDKETMQWLGYSLDNGNLLWGPVGNPGAYQYYGSPMFPTRSGYIYKGSLYTAGYGGVLYCYDTLTGTLKWTYGNGGEGNSTNSGLNTPWGNYPTFPCGIADGKVYLYTTEHSPNAPPYKDARIRCVDAADRQRSLYSNELE